jgi:hypothetical protein
MATHTQGRPSAAPYAKGEGWLTYAGILLFIGGVLNAIWGVAAIDASRFFVAGADYVISDLQLWGWVALIAGVAFMLTSVGVFRRSHVAMWAGIVLATVNTITQMLSIDAYPLWALAVVTLNVLAVYGLVAHGIRR